MGTKGKWSSRKICCPLVLWHIGSVWMDDSGGTVSAHWECLTPSQLRINWTFGIRNYISFLNANTDINWQQMCAGRGIFWGGKSFGIFYVDPFFMFKGQLETFCFFLWTYIPCFSGWRSNSQLTPIIIKLWNQMIKILTIMSTFRPFVISKHYYVY